MIKNLKTFTIAMLATGATVLSANAKAPAITNNGDVLQPVTVTLTVYGGADASFKTADLYKNVTNSLTNVFSKKAELALVTTSLKVQTGTTNVTTTVTTNIPNTLPLSTNTYLIGTNGGPNTDLTIGDTSGSYYVTITATNGTTNLLVTTATLGAGGTVSTTTGTSGTTLTLDANQTLAIGSNAAVATETNLAFGGTAESVDSGVGVAIVSNGTVITSLPIGTNSVDFTLTNVTVGASTNNPFGTNEIVEFTNAFVTNIVYSNGVPVGYGTSNSAFNTSLTTTFTVVATNGATNVQVVTSATDLVQGSESVTITVPVYATNVSSAIAIADQGTNTFVPTNILYVAQVGTNDVTVAKPAAGYNIESLILNTTPLTSAHDPLSLTLQGLLKSTTAKVTISKGNVVTVTNYSWSDVSGYGLKNNTTPIILGGTITVASPSAEKQ
jgi:hypothetical protein